jgi:hypothetical protein
VTNGWTSAANFIVLGDPEDDVEDRGRDRDRQRHGQCDEADDDSGDSGADDRDQIHQGGEDAQRGGVRDAGGRAPAEGRYTGDPRGDEVAEHELPYPVHDLFGHALDPLAATGRQEAVAELFDGRQGRHAVQGHRDHDRRGRDGTQDHPPGAQYAPSLS